MKIAIIIIRSLLGLLLLFASLAYFFNFQEKHELSGDLKTAMAGFMATKYIFPVAKFVELICGLSFVSGKYTRLSSIILIPISLNIFLIHTFLEPDDILVGAFLFLGNLFMIYTNWDAYKDLFKA